MNSENEDKLGEGSVSSGSPIRDEVAVLFRRMADRFFPYATEVRCASNFVRYGVTLLGTLFWFLIAFLIIAILSLSGSTSSEPNTPSQIFATADIQGMIIQNLVLFIAICVFVGVMFTCLIGLTFRHGRPLTFFFYALFYLSLAVSIVKYAFLFGTEMSK